MWALTDPGPLLLPASALRLAAIPSLPPLTASRRGNSNRAAVSHLHRQQYGRLYPVLLVKTDGSTIRLRYREPKRILMVRREARGGEPGGLGGGTGPSRRPPQLPLDSSTLPEAQRKARLRRQFPSRLKARAEETFEGIDLDTYRQFWKK